MTRLVGLVVAGGGGWGIVAATLQGRLLLALAIFLLTFAFVLLSATRRQ